MPTVAELDIKINAEDDATGTIARLDALIRGLDGDDIDVDVNVDTGEAEVDIAHLIEEINSISDENVNIETDIDGAVEDIARLEAELKAIPDETVTVETDIDDKPIRRAKKSMSKFEDTSLNASRQISFLATAILGLGTALIPIGAVGVGGVIALASAFGVAGAGAALFGLAAKTAFTPVADALKKMHTYQTAFNQAVTDNQRDAAMKKMASLMASLTQDQRDMVTSVENFRGAWGRLVAQIQPQVFKIASEGLDGIRKILPDLLPILQSTAGALLFLERAGTRALAGPFWQSFLDMMGNEAGPLLRVLGLSIGNLITGFGALIMAFMPLTEDFSTGLLGMSKSFSDWAQKVSQTKSFQNFVAYIRENTPLVLSLIGQFVMGFIAIAKAGAPLGEALVKATTRLFEMISAFQKAHPAALTVTLAIIGLTAVAANLIGPLILVTKFVYGLATGFGYLEDVAVALEVSEVALMATVFAVAAVVAALVVGIIYAYRHFQIFHDAVNAVGSVLATFGQNAYQAIVGWLGSAASWLTATFGPAVMAVVAFATAQFNKIVGWATENAATFQAAWNNIVNILSWVWNQIVSELTGALNIIKALWNFFWPTLSVILQGVWTAIKGIVSGTLDIIMGVILVFASLFALNWSTLWSGVVQILKGIWEIIKGVVTGGFQVLQVLVSTYLAIVRALWSAAWNLITGGLRAAWNTIISIVKWGWGVVTASWRGFQQGIQAGVNAFWATVIAIFRGAWNLIIGGLAAAWNTIRSGASGAWNGIVSVVSSAAGRMRDGIRNRINDAVDSIREFGPRAIGILSGLGGRFYSAGASLLRSLASGIRAGIGNAIGAMKSAIGSLTDLLPGSPAKTGPLSGQGYAYIRGQHLAEDLAAGISGRSGLVGQAARDIADLMSLTTDPAGAYSAMTRGAGGITINVGEGAVALQLGAGVNPKEARAAFDSAGATLADNLLTAIRRREG